MILRVLLLFGITLACAKELGPQYRGPRTDALARSGTASIHETSALFLNPAGLAGLEGKGVEMSAGVGVNRELLDYADWVSNNEGAFNHFDSLLNSIGAIENKWASITESYYLQGRFGEIAVSVVRDSRYDVSLGKAVLLPKVGAGILSDFQVAAGRGFELSQGWTAGFTLKYLDRQRYDDRMFGENDNEYYIIKDRWQDSSAALKDKLAKIEVGSEIAPHQKGFGANFGVNHSFSNGFSMGASVLDLPTFLDGKLVHPQLNLGGAYQTNFGAQTEQEGWRFPSVWHFNLLLNFDLQIPITRSHSLVEDGEGRFPVGSSYQWFKQVKTGMAFETFFHQRQVAMVSTGLSDGYPCFGVRVGYLVHAYYLNISDELGNYPGQERRAFQRFGIDLDI